MTVFMALVAVFVFVTSSRASAADLVVDSTADTVAVDGVCTLREAIANANNDASINADCAAGTGTDTITFTGAGVGTITLSSTLPNVIDLDGLTIDGGNQVTISGNDAVQILRVSPDAVLALENLTTRDAVGAMRNEGTLAITNSTVSNNFSDSGGAIFNRGTVTITDSTVSDNVGDQGGAILNSGTLTITNSILSGNSTALSDGGAIYNAGAGTVTITNSTLVGNASNTSNGGAIFNHGATVTITNSTLAGNSANGDGGAIYNIGTTLMLVNSTLSGNTAISGGGIVNGGTLTLMSSTLSGNTALGLGGGILNGDFSTLTVTNSIVANRPAGGNSGGNCANFGTVIANSSNLDTDGTCPGFSHVPGGQLKIDALADNGGPTQTHALLCGSVAINAGDEINCPATDQRGVAREGRCDIGAFEFRTGRRPCRSTGQ
jgi:CSLREA domain-containing protein